MRERDDSTLLGLYFALVIHGILAVVLVRVYMRNIELTLRYQSQEARSEGGLLFSPEGPALASVQPRDRSPLRVPKVEVNPEPEKPRPVVRKPELASLEEQFGEANGKGTSMNSSEGERPLEGRKGEQDQAWLSRDPVGPGMLPPVPSPFAGVPGENGDNRPRRPMGAGGDGTPEMAPLAAALGSKTSVSPTPFGPRGGGGQPPVIVAPKVVAPPPTPPPPAPVATVRPVPPEENVIGIQGVVDPTTRPIDPDSKLKGRDSVAENLPAGPETKLRPKVKPPTTRPNDTVAEVPLSDKTLPHSPATRPTQVAVDQKVHPESKHFSPTTQPAKRVAANAEPSDKSKPEPTTRPVQTADIDANPKRPNPDQLVEELLKRPPTTMPREDLASKTPSTRPSKTPGLEPGEPESQIAAMVPREVGRAGEASVPRPAQAQSKHPGPGGTPDAGGGRAGPPIMPADPAPQSDQESDAFSTKGTVTMRAGKIEARLGRKVKPVRPRLTLSGELDVYDNVVATVVMRVSIDPTGKVTDVRTIKSSGSNSIDHPTEMALYQWWIEPAKNKAGEPVKDTILLTIAFR